MDLFEFDFFRDWELEQPCHLESDRSALKRREWERRNQEVQQDEDLFSTGFNLFGEPYKTNKGDALASRVQNTLGSYEEMKDLLTSHSNQSHLVGIPKGSNNVQTPTTSTAERPAMEPQLFNEALRGGTGVGEGGAGGGGEGGVDKRTGNSSSSSTSMQPPASSASSTSATTIPHQNSKKSRSSMDWSRAGHGQSAQGPGLVLGLAQNGQGQVTAAASGRGKMSLLEEQQMQRHEELFSSLKDELGLKGDSSPSSPSSSSSSSSSSGRRHSSHPSKALPLPDGGNFRSSTMDGGHFKSSTNTENGGHFKSSPLENETGCHLSTSSSSPLASTSVLTTPTPGLTTPTSGLTTPTFPPGSLSGKPIAVQQKPTAYVRPMDGQDQAPSDSPQLKPPLVTTEGFNNGQSYGGNSGNAKNKLPKLSLSHAGEVSLPNDSSCVEEILREMTHSWPPPLTAIHTPGKADQTKFPIPTKESQHVTSGYNTQKRCNVSANKPAGKPPTAPQKSMLEDDLKISSDEEEAEQQVSDKPKARGTALSGASGSSSESESSSESDTDESESSSSDSECNRASRTHTPEPEPPSANKWQLDSWLNKVQTQPKPLVPPQKDHGTGTITQGPRTFSPRSEAPGVGAPAKTKPCGSSSTPVPAAPTVEHKDTRGAFCPGREKAKAKLSQKASGEGQRPKMRMSPGLLSVPEVLTPRRITTGKKQPRRTERSNSVEDNPSQTWSRTNHHSPAAREKDLLPPPSLELQNPLRPRSKPPSGKTAPRKEPRSATNSNSNTVTPPAAVQQPPVPIPAVSVNQDKRKHRGPSTKITPKSREFIETDSSSSECHSDPEEAVKNPTLPPQTTRSAMNTLTLSNTHVHAPLLPCLGSAVSIGGLGTFGGKGLRVKDGSNVTTNGSSGSYSSISAGSNGSSSSCNSLSVSNISGSFGTSVPDPGGLGAQSKEPESMSPPSNIGHEVPLSPLREYQEIKSLWVKIDLSLLGRVPGQGSGERSRVEMPERDGSERRDRERQAERERIGGPEREKQKQAEREWPGLRERLPKGEKQEEENERLVQDRERQGDRDRLAERERQMDREDRERLGLGERERERTTGRDREKVCQGVRVLDNPSVQEQSNPRLADRMERGENGGKHRRQAAGNMVVPTEKHTSKSKRKHKSDHSESSTNGNKKLRLDKDCLLLPPCISPIHNHKNSSTDSLNRKQSRRRDDKLLPPLLSPLSDDPPRKRTCDSSSSLSQDATAAGMLPSSASSSSTSSSSHRHRRGEGKASSHARNGSEVDTHSEKPSGDGYHANGQSDSEAWSEPAEHRRPRLSFSDTVHSADYYMQEAKRLKHKADALMDKFGKAVNYADGALSFIECGNAMERDPLEAKSPYTMYSETVELIRYAMRLKNFTSHSASVAEKKLAVLCNRCLSLLYLRMFHLKKDHAVKYSRSLMEYFKNSAKSSHQAPSPWRTNGKVNGTPSPLSLCPSPASSGGGGGASGGALGSSGSVAIPQRIHHMAASHVNITNNILRSYEHWETADRLATDSKEFFQELDSVMEPLSQQSSMTELVRHIRQGLHWLRLEAHLL
ncbi:AF4/FMR2 family member 2 isoform X2 [Etheostoma cragini]|uniref:AF4/FMR2 family member 2 isoform X2 n=1 Tax=Etheostoma cragini TaxID=417921 RepID=UPI00155DDF54|nr:AF4/FMR2 family member 2 isoform X2 [Etheostoma cragini]